MALARLLLLASAAILVPLDLPAQPFSDLYRAETIVTGNEEPERTRGLRIILADVVMKLTGDAGLAEDPKLEALLADPHALLADIEYEDRMKGIPTHDEQGTRERPHFLRARFDKAAMNAALTDLGLALWDRPRPTIEVRLDVRTPAAAYVVASEGPDGYGQRMALTDTAARRGLPIALPESDTTVAFDEVAAIVDDATPVQGLDTPTLHGVLDLSSDSAYWDVDWRMIAKGRDEAWSQDGVTFDKAIRTGLTGAASILSGEA
ncbi:MAG: DUF2066 domain-containing protein [Pseudomonadota bacterium]